jgi:hypothetical protein
MKIVRRNYFILLLLALVFLTPGISAYFFYTHPQWLAATPTNKGVFLSPPVLLAPLAQSGANKWRFVLWSPGACEASCIAQLDKLARIRLALGRRLYGVVTVLVLGANAPPLPDELVTALRERDINSLKLVTDSSEILPALQNRLGIFIANPDNYLVLAYQPTVKPDDIYNDIKQLLTTTDKMSK